MKAFNEFMNRDVHFWHFIKYISESLGYTERKQHCVKKYSPIEIKELCNEKNIHATDETIISASIYSQMRANILNNFVEHMLMTAETAKVEFEKLEKIHNDRNCLCKIPMNKQKGNKKQIAFFTSMINIITEIVIREILNSKNELGFDDDPHGLIYIKDEYNRVIGSLSRRFDGAYPTLINPQIVWEIKEYYYATTFGSRVADGVYETLLDGLELQNIFHYTGRKIYHILFIDAYGTWWIQGKSYLCRLVDSINIGLVDEIIFGKEIFARWPELLKEIIGSKL